MLWPEDASLRQLQRFAEEVRPAVLDMVAQARRITPKGRAEAP
jgi:hypothetical protein